MPKLGHHSEKRRHLNTYKEDFRKAQFFFCTGMDDPWLKELLLRSLIVRHASWVTLCAAEKFLMPIARYTLDDGFDESKIRVLNPSTLSVDPPHSDAQRSKDHRQNQHRNPCLSRKRPKKRARIDEQRSRENVEAFKGRKTSATCDRPATLRAQNVEDLGCAPRRISFTGRKSIPSGKVSRTAKAFESRIKLSNTTPPMPSKEPTETMQSPLNPHTLFWNDLLAKSYAKEAKTLTFSVNDLLLTPETNAVIFDVNKTYLGRNFINMEYA
ncbi:hypothetical protein CPB84DRAFT_1843044 [Gymnopilus junonius]|uniref:Uncharacterized protein n=1 Tax=Gymnopilus junonius TaxID=109634 RepID=A0A9P5TSM6_GYMJU|nr:hypothetical protein CPB84DRAFT_1843044 [Gymnopilus junonius]